MRQLTKGENGMKVILGNFSEWLFAKIIGYLFYATILFVGVPLTLPYINNYLISEIAKEMERQHKITRIRADRGYRYLMGYDR